MPTDKRRKSQTYVASVVETKIDCPVYLTKTNEQNELKQTMSPTINKITQGTISSISSSKKRKCKSVEPLIFMGMAMTFVVCIWLVSALLVSISMHLKSILHKPPAPLLFTAMGKPFPKDPVNLWPLVGIHYSNNENDEIDNQILLDALYGSCLPHQYVAAEV